MKFTCLQNNLTDALTKVYRAVPTKSELPILSNILISAEDNRIKLSATNLSTTIITHVGASIEEEGAITVPAKMLRDLVANLSSNSLEVVLKDDVLHLKSDATKTKINGVAADDYPDLPQEKENLISIELDPKDFFNAIASVAFCASLDDSRPIFTGIFMRFSKDTATFAASDGFRLSEIKFPVKNKGEEFSVIIPAKTLVDIAKVFSDTESKIIFALDQNDNLALFKQNDSLIATRLIDGEYPDYTRIIPAETKNSALFDTAPFLEAVKLTDVFAKESDSAMIMKISTKGTVELAASAREAGEHRSKIKADVDAEEDTEIGFNSKFLLDFLNNIKHEKISAKTEGHKSPCVFRAEGKENFIHIIMPMQINEN